VRRPIIGMTTYGEPVRFGAGERDAALLPLAYPHAVHRAGGRALLITEDDPGEDVLDALDGIVFTGGADIAPALYDAEPGPRTRCRPARDAVEMPLLRAALSADLPVLAICRGMQLLVAAYGGALHQHLPDVLGHEGHRPPDGYGAHEVRMARGTRASELLGASVTVNSLHHQGIADPGRLRASGWVAEPALPGEGLIEVVEDPSRRFVLGVQWHPEDGDDLRLFSALVEATRSR